ncbi:hypothetical protein F2P81_026220 [Scophthalmus maximus]|uniref:Triadin n=1 Tax=Scophthalmus maximus TaxID=52904 RepID=A0A6A4RN40_SCOMX|nr:hypothetical protein F2P81_026220 [Scophthalmus maximus]
MSSQANGGAVVPSARTNQKTFLDDVILTFSSPMAWLLVVALILTWSGVAIVLFDLLDYKTLAAFQTFLKHTSKVERALTVAIIFNDVRVSDDGTHAGSLFSFQHVLITSPRLTTCAALSAACVKK